MKKLHITETGYFFSIAFMLADMCAKLEASRQLIWHCCRCADAGIRNPWLSSAAKCLFAFVDLGFVPDSGATAMPADFGAVKFTYREIHA